MSTYLLKFKDVVDEVQIWLNTTDQKDLRYAYTLNDAHPEYFKLVDAGPRLRAMDHNSRCKRLKYFYHNCVMPDTVYIKMDDDLVYFSHNFINDFLETMWNNPTSFITFANIVNNGICNHLHQRASGQHGLDEDPFASFSAGAGQGWWWNSWEGGYVAHDRFLSALRISHHRNLQGYILPDWRMYAEHMSINCIGWWGYDWMDLVPEHLSMIENSDENALSEWVPRELGKNNMISGKALCAHYSYFPQEAGLRETDILERYRKIAGAPYSPEPGLDIQKKFTNIYSNDDILDRIMLIRDAKLEKLQDAEWLEHELIPQLGLYSGDYIYAPEELRKYCGGLEIWQSPKQLSKYLAYISKYNITHYGEFGIARGGNFIVLTEYLARFGLKYSAACDLYIPEILQAYERSTPEGVVVKVNPGSSFGYNKYMVNNKTKDDISLVFVDDKHEYPEAMRHFRNHIGSHQLIAYHDVNDPLCPGLMKFWKELHDDLAYTHNLAITEFFDTYDDVKVRMGIGLIENWDI